MTPTVLITAPLLKDFQQKGMEIITVAIEEVASDFKNSNQDLISCLLYSLPFCIIL